MVERLVICCAAFDDELLKTVKQGVSKLPAPAHRTRVLCTLEMINHIITINTSATASMWQVMLATGISMAFFLCLSFSEYVSRTIVPIEDTHQFLSTDVEFMLNDGTMRFVASNNIQAFKFYHFKVVKFSILHAKQNTTRLWHSHMVFHVGFGRAISSICPSGISLVKAF